MKKDLFGFVTQGAHYDQFRPRYPLTLVGQCLKNLQQKVNYLDVATGTGQLLFPLAADFSGRRIGTDISDKMIKVASDKALEFQKDSGIKIEILKKDCLQSPVPGTKFDLITVGQALHWFKISEFLANSKTLLGGSGKLAVLGYYPQGVYALNGDNQVPLAFNQFYAKVKPLFDFNRDQLHNQYKDEKYNFGDYFPKVTRLSQTAELRMSRQGVLGYLKTWSGYNTYLEKNKDDPIKIVEQALKDHQEALMKITYFGVYCQI